MLTGCKTLLAFRGPGVSTGGGKGSTAMTAGGGGGRNMVVQLAEEDRHCCDYCLAGAVQLHLRLKSPTMQLTWTERDIYLGDSAL